MVGRAPGPTAQGCCLRLDRGGYVFEMGSPTPDGRPWWRRPEGMPAWMQRRADAARNRELTRGRILFLRLYVLTLLCAFGIAVVLRSWVLALVFLSSPVTTMAIWPAETRKAVLRGLFHGSEKRARRTTEVLTPRRDVPGSPPTPNSTLRLRELDVAAGAHCGRHPATPTASRPPTPHC